MEERNHTGKYCTEESIAQRENTPFYFKAQLHQSVRWNCLNMLQVSLGDFKQQLYAAG